MRQPRFAKGDQVQRINDPSIGVIRSSRYQDQTESYAYEVLINGQTLKLPEEALTHLNLQLSPWEMLKENRYAGAKQFRQTLTFHRLRRPPTRIANSFATAKTQFYPHQFKPLLKFLDNPNKRLLIADDVGLGKTIEAGYILTELKAREAIDRVLILVPSRLRTKWKKELELRFNEHFEIIGRKQLLNILGQISQGRQIENFKFIISYESGRDEAVLSALENTPLHLDLLIADEVHRCRNSDTAQHRLARQICTHADAAVFLSATPVQNKLEDLWQLLRLLSEEEFKEFQVFEQQMHDNKELLNAQSALKYKDQRQTALSSLNRFLSGRFGNAYVSSELVRSILSRLQEPNLTIKEITEIQADIGRLSPINHVLSRTRRAEAIHDRAQRNAKWNTVVMSTIEKQIYSKVSDWCAKASGLTQGSWGHQMALLTAYRMTASCIPAALEYFQSKIGTEVENSIIELIEDEQGVEDANEQTDRGVHQGVRLQLQDVTREFADASFKDSKFSTLLTALNDIWADDKVNRQKRRKVVLFSFFRGTVSYLTEQLKKHGISVRTIHGGMDIAEREMAIEQFLENDSIDVLITSDVGGEGIDLQKASVLVNYDLPWNPMVVEQRIGRIDRIGQQESVIIILNLVMEGSVEERILQRLLRKIGIFEDSVGEIDPIIGENVERITADVVSGRMKEEDLKRTLAEEEKILENNAKLNRDLKDNMDKLIASDQAIADEIQAVTGEQQIPSESSLKEFLNSFFADHLQGYQLPDACLRSPVEVDLSGKLASMMYENRSQMDDGTVTFASRIERGKIKITFSREQAYRHQKTDLIHLNHPLMRLAVQAHIKSGKTSDYAFVMRLPHSEILLPGAYSFVVELLELKVNVNAVHLQGVFQDLHRGTLYSDSAKVAAIIIELLDHAVEERANSDEIELALSSQSKILNAIDSLVNEVTDRTRKLDLARKEQQLNSKLALALHKKQRAERALQTVKSRSHAPAVINMAVGKVQKATNEIEALRRQNVNPESVAPDRQEIAVGLLIVGDK